MEILLYDDENNRNSENLEAKYDLEINLTKSKANIYEKEVNKNTILNFLDFLIVKIDLKKEKKLNYIGTNRRVWTYLLIFSYITEKITIKYKGNLVKESKILNLNFKNLIDENILKNRITKDEYEKIPKILQNLYYFFENDKFILSKIGEVYVQNIKNI